MEKNSQQGVPLVTIRCLVYNHEPFLRQCLDGFVMQQTTFPFEAIVHDDASTDGSAAIIREYAEKYPDIIKPIYETENQYHKHDASIGRAIRAAMHPDSKYIATCEGDDYWTDPNKLQIQVDFLESHPDYYMTCHAFVIFDEETKRFQDHPFVDELPLSPFNGRLYCSPTLNDFFFSAWFVKTLSLVRRREQFISDDILRRYKCAYDYIVGYYMMKKGKCALFKDVMGVYRRHGGGVFSGRDDLEWEETWLLNNQILYQLEKEQLIIPKLNDHYTYLMTLLLKRHQFIKGLTLTYKQFKVLPLINVLKCWVNLFKRAVSFR